MRYVYKVGYLPQIDYEYFVDGRRYRSNRLQIARVGYDDLRADAIIRRYRPDRTITVRHHPRYRHQAYLIPDKRNAVLSLLLSAIGCLLAASLVAALLLATVYDQLMMER